MIEIINIAHGVLLVSGFQFLVGVLGIEKWFDTWEIDRKTIVVTSLVTAFGGVMLLTIGGVV